MKRLKVKIELAPGLEREYIIERHMDEDIPTDDFILNDFSAHYHIATKRSLPPTSKVLSVEDITNAVG